MLGGQLPQKSEVGLTNEATTKTQHHVRHALECTEARVER
jgi:hypothetical protein